MNLSNGKKLTLAIFSSIILLVSGCAQQSSEQSQQSQEPEQSQESEVDAIFPRGELGSSEYFTGDAYNYGLVANDSTYTTVIGNVYFEPGARSNWHSHPAGQILIITAGKGYHQIEGQPIQELKEGDVAKCPPNTRHWHGASPDTGMQQIYVLPNTENGIVEWMEAVTDEQYSNN